MINIKRIELVIEAVEMPLIMETLKNLGLNAYTYYKHVGGNGDRGSREDLVFGEKFENVTFVIACPEEKIADFTENIRPILKSYGGMCLISDAMWVLH